MLIQNINFQVTKIFQILYRYLQKPFYLGIIAKIATNIERIKLTLTPLKIIRKPQVF